MAQGLLPFSFLDLFVPGASSMAQFGQQAAQRGVEVSVQPGQPMPAPDPRMNRPERPKRPVGPRTRAGKVVEEAKKGEAGKDGEKGAEKGAEVKPSFAEKARVVAPKVGLAAGAAAALYFVGKAVFRG
jgi:hypothetical protein